MIKLHDIWTISELEKYAHKISYPEYQREQTVWDRLAKQRLIDSILRGFDIASVYFYVPDVKQNKDDIDEFECIDGRQRINAILCFIGKNTDEDLEKDWNFKIRVSNEVDPTQSDEDINLLNGKKYNELNTEELKKWKQKIDDHQINVVLVSNIDEDKNELNLFFQRLNLGKPLNAGEKLHAMAGDMKNYIFNAERGITLNDYFQKLDIPPRRFAKEQVAAQIVCNYFAKYSDEEKAKLPPGSKNVYSRTRYYDLQLFFKDKMHFLPSDNELTEKIRTDLPIVYQAFEGKIEKIKNRAIAVSAFLYSKWLISQKRETDLEKFSEFIVKLINRVNWQVKKLSKTRRGDPEYYEELFRFQSYITQAAGETYAIAGREAILHDLFQHYLANGFEIKGDSGFKERNAGIDPDTSPIEELE